MLDYLLSHHVDGRVYNALKVGGYIGIIKHRTCPWCKCVIYEGQEASTYCSEDCRQEYQDFRAVTGYRKLLNDMRIKYHKNKKLKGRTIQKPYTERKKAYYQANKEKIKAQMRAIRLKHKLEKQSKQ